jgi:hypothetical protein
MPFAFVSPNNEGSFHPMIPDRLTFRYQCPWHGILTTFNPMMKKIAKTGTESHEGESSATQAERQEKNSTKLKSARGEIPTSTTKKNTPKWDPCALYF